MNNRIATSQRRQMRALAVQGIFATDCHAQLRGLLQRHLGPAHAVLLAEPQHDATTGTIDWYTPLAGKAIPCQDLPPEESRKLASRAVSMAVDIEALARRLRDRQQDAHALSGGLLELCCLHHDVSDLYSVGGQPVLINWGFAPGGAGAEPQDLTRLGGMAAPAPAAVPPAVTPPPLPPSSRTGCAGWLLPFLLLLLLLWLLLSALGWLPFWWPASCVPQPDKAALQAEADRTLRLDDELQALLRQLREKAALCRPAPPPVPEPAPEPEPEPPMKKPEADVVEPFFGESPVEPEPEPAPQPKPEPKPEPRPEPKAEPRPAPQPKPRKGEEMQIPKDAAKKKDLSFLEGCWVSETGLFSHPANKPVIAEYCFDKNGRGRRFVREEGGRVCSGPSQARFNNGRLQFDAGPATCPRGSRFVPQRVECQGSQDSTQCRGQEQDGKRSTWKARFRRK